MSELPKVPKRSKPKSLGTDVDIATPEHEHLVATVWNHLDAIVLKHCILSARLIERELVRLTKLELEKTGEYARKFGDAIDQGQFRPSFRVVYDHQTHVPDVILNAAELKKLKAAKAQLEHYAATLQLSFDPGSQETQVMARTFQKSLSNEKGVVVGFVDMEAKVFHPAGLEFCWRNVWKEEREVSIAMSSSELLKAVEFGERVAPEIQCAYKTTHMWFDVRSELPTTAVLVRELKTLRELARLQENATYCVLVAPDIPPFVSDVMNNEGFGCINLSPWLDQAPAS